MLWTGSPEILAFHQPGSEDQTGGLLVVSSHLDSLSLICRICGAHKPHSHAKAIPHQWGTLYIICC